MASRRRGGATTHVAMPQTVWHLKNPGKVGRWHADVAGLRAAPHGNGIHNPGVGAVRASACSVPDGLCRLMPKCIDIPVGDLTPEQRRRQVALILAQGVFRFVRAAQLAESGDLSPDRATGLELVSETRLSVSGGLARDPECEVNDGRIA